MLPCFAETSWISGPVAQECLQDRQETGWIVGMQPVAGGFYGDEAGFREHGADDRTVLRQDVVGVRAGDEQGRTVVGAGRIRPALQVGYRGGDLVQADAPVRTRAE